MIIYAHIANEEYRKKHRYESFAHQINTYDTSRPFFIAEEELLDTQFSTIANQYLKWGNLHDDNLQPTLHFFENSWQVTDQKNE